MSINTTASYEGILIFKCEGRRGMRMKMMRGDGIEGFHGFGNDRGLGEKEN